MAVFESKEATAVLAMTKKTKALETLIIVSNNRADSKESRLFLWSLFDVLAIGRLPSRGRSCGVHPRGRRGMLPEELDVEDVEGHESK